MIGGAGKAGPWLVDLSTWSVKPQQLMGVGVQLRRMVGGGSTIVFTSPIPHPHHCTIEAVAVEDYRARGSLEYRRVYERERETQAA